MYLKDSTMAVTIPVTVITIPRTQKRPVHEVKSTWQGGRTRLLSELCHNKLLSKAGLPPPGSPSAACWGQESDSDILRTDRKQFCRCSSYEGKGVRASKGIPSLGVCTLPGLLKCQALRATSV